MRQLIDQFITKTEAQTLQARLDALGWQPAAVRFSSGVKNAPQLRDSERVEFIDQTLSDELWARIQKRIDAETLRLIAGEPEGPLALRSWFRGYRYGPGQRFGKHRDAFELDGDFITRVTALIYLSDSLHGEGATLLYPEKDRSQPAERVEPQCGSLLLFHSSQLHEGEAPRVGTKMVLRSDLMFKRP